MQTALLMYQEEQNQAHDPLAVMGCQMSMNKSYKNIAVSYDRVNLGGYLLCKKVLFFKSLCRTEGHFRSTDRQPQDTLSYANKAFLSFSKGEDFIS